MKIVETDNYGGDYPDEHFVTGIPRLSQEAAEAIADILNAEKGSNSHRYYMVVKDDYELKPGFEP